MNVSHVLGDEYIAFEEIDDARWGAHAFNAVMAATGKDAGSDLMPVTR